jgi:hypothetical protein
MMAEIEIFPFPGEAAVGGLFDAATCAEGRLAWFETLARTTLARDEHAVLVVALDDDRPVGALPLVRTRGGLRALTAPYTTRYAPPLPDAHVARELGLRAREYVPGALRLDGLDPDDAGSAAFLQGLSGSGLMTARYQGFANWYEPVTDFESWWARRPSRLKTTVRRKLSAAMKQGAKFQCVGDGFDEAVAAYQEIHGESWKDAEPHPEFIPAMVRALSPEGLVRIGVMTLAGRAVAAQIWLVCGRRATIFKLAHREDAAELSPGTLLTHHMAETLIEQHHLEEIDFGRGNDAYKRDWLGRSRARIGVIAGDWQTRLGLAAIIEEVLPTRLGALVREFGRRRSAIRRGSVAARRVGVLSLTRLGRMTPHGGPAYEVAGDP